MERLLDPSLFMRFYFGGLLVMPIFLALTVAWSLSTLPEPGRRILGAVIGFNLLSVLSILTIGAVITLVIITALRSRVIYAPVDLRAGLRAVVTSTGYGTAIGVIAAALLPIFVRYFSASSAATYGSDASLSPQVLIDIPAAGAVLGYGFGVGLGIVDVMHGAENLAVRRFLAPSLFFCVLVLLRGIDLTPRGLLSALASPSEVSCADGRAWGDLESPDAIFRSVRWCEPGWSLLDDGVFLWGTAIYLAMVAICYLAADVRSKSRRMPRRG